MTLILDMPMQDDAASPAVNDVSASNNNGTATVNTNAISVNGPGNNLQKALNLGSDTIALGVSVGTFASHTVQFFAKRPDKTANDYVIGDSTSFSYIRFDANTDTLRFRDAFGVDGTILTTVDTTEWHHYAFVYTPGSDVQLVIDNISVGTSTITDQLSFDRIGGSLVGNNRTILAGIKIYDELRTVAQIATDGYEGFAPSVPSDLPVLELWLDATDESTITHSGGAVSQWNDKSGNNRNVVQATASAKPTTGVDTINGRNAITFDGVDDFMSGGDVLDLVLFDRTVFAVVRTDGAVFQGILTKSRSAQQTMQRWALATNSSHIFSQYDDGPGAVVQPEGAIVVTGDPRILAAVFDRDADLTNYVDGGADGSASIAATSGTNLNSTITLKVGAHGISTSDTLAANFFAGQIAEIVVYNRVLTAQETIVLMEYFNKRWFRNYRQPASFIVGISCSLYG